MRIMWTGGQFCLLHFAKPDLYSRQFYKSDSFEHQALIKIRLRKEEISYERLG